jgi:acyl-CoA synthetase (AMP-forming)/AMP-acid ligase II
MPQRHSLVVKAWAEKFPTQLALRCNGQALNYGELWQYTLHAMEKLQELEIRPGDRVVLVGEVGLQMVPLLLAVSELDAWAVPLDATRSVRDVEQIRIFSGCRRILYCVGDSVLASDHARADITAHFEPSFLLGAVAVGASNEAAQSEAVRRDAAHQTAAIFWKPTADGGSQGVMLSHQALMFVGSSIAQLTAIGRADTLCYTSSNVYPFGLDPIIMSAFYAGAAVELVPHMTSQQFIQILREGRVSCLIAEQKDYGQVLDFAEQQGLSLWSPKLRIVQTVGGRNHDLEARIENCFGLWSGNLYGVPECWPIAHSSSMLTPDIGSLLPEVEVRLVREDGNEASPGERGEIWVRGPCRMLGYYHDAVATAARLREGGWLATGDVAVPDGAGRMLLVDGASARVLAY